MPTHAAPPWIINVLIAGTISALLGVIIKLEIDRIRREQEE